LIAIKIHFPLFLFSHVNSNRPSSILHTVCPSENTETPLQATGMSYIHERKEGGGALSNVGVRVFLNGDCHTVEYFEKLQWQIISLNKFLPALIKG